MDLKRQYLELKCEICSLFYLQQERVHKKCKWKNRCKTHRKNIKTIYNNNKTENCIDCNIPVYRKSIRCKICSVKMRTGPAKQCNKCNKIITHKAKLCLACHNKKQDQGKSRERAKFTASTKWQKLRKLCLIRDSYSCQKCGVVDLVLHAHHIKSYSKYPELRLILSNLQTLCIICHRKVHGLQKKK